MASKARCLVFLTVAALGASCSGATSQPANHKGARSPTVEIAGVTLVRAEPEVLRQCLRLARRVGYPLPCPRLLPEYATPYWGTPRGPTEFFQAGTTRPFRGWVSLSVTFVPRSESDGHLVISAAPKRVDARHLIFKPRPYPGEELQAVGRTRVRGREAKWFYVSAGESIYLGHTVLVWWERGRTYAVGFHGRGAAIRDLGLAVAGRISLSP